MRGLARQRGGESVRETAAVRGPEAGTRLWGSQRPPCEGSRGCDGGVTGEGRGRGEPVVWGVELVWTSLFILRNGVKCGVREANGDAAAFQRGHRSSRRRAHR